MTERKMKIDGREWTVSIIGRVTVYEKDEFSLLFERKDEQGRRVRRVSRFSPQGARSRAQALAELSEAELNALFQQSAADTNSPELNYARG